MPMIDPDTDLLPDEQALLDGKPISADPPDEPGDDAALTAEALAAIAAKGVDEPAAPAPQPVDASATPVKAPAEPPALPTFAVDDPAKFTETFEALQAKKATAFKELMDGTMEPDAYAAIEGEVTQGLLKLNTNMTLHEQNQQQEKLRQRSVLEAIAADAAKRGVDYSDPDVGAMFDAKRDRLAAAPENAGKSADDIFALANQAMLKMFGKDGPAPSPSPAPAPAPAAAGTPAAPAPKPQIPPTLGALPAAATPTVSNGLLETLGGIEDPDQAEEMLAKMPAHQREQTLRATVPSRRR